MQAIERAGAAGYDIGGNAGIDRRRCQPAMAEQHLDGRWSTDHNRQKVFDNKCDARPVCDELRSLCPRDAEV
jgi:hypothetical protein